MTQIAPDTAVLNYQSPPAKPVEPKWRLSCIDAYRGLVMLLMMDEVLRWGSTARKFPGSKVWEWVSFSTSHVEWDSIRCSLHDLIQPSFSFLVGVAVPFSLASRIRKGQSFGWMLLHAVWRAILLMALGIFLRSMHSRQTNFTFEDTLTQIGLGYVFLFLLGWVKVKWQAVALGVILVGYWAAFMAYPLPGPGYDYSLVRSEKQNWQYDRQGMGAHFNKNTNLAMAFDRKFLNTLPREKAFRFNGGGYATLSFIPTLGTMILGLMAGRLLQARLGVWKTVGILVGCGVLGLGLGWVLDWSNVCPVVKRIWTPSWVIYSGGFAALFLAFFYLTTDAIGWRAWAMPLIVVGMNSIAMYVLTDGGLAELARESFRIHFGWLIQRAGGWSTAVEGACVLGVLWGIAVWLYRKKLFIRI